MRYAYPSTVGYTQTPESLHWFSQSTKQNKMSCSAFSSVFLFFCFILFCSVCFVFVVFSCYSCIPLVTLKKYTDEAVANCTGTCIEPKLLLVVTSIDWCNKERGGGDSRGETWEEAGGREKRWEERDEGRSEERKDTCTRSKLSFSTCTSNRFM